jgi:BRCT domain type II-containing protein
VGISLSDLEHLDSLQEEFQVIKKAYFTKILREHPDKGGDPQLFRQTRASFQVLRDRFQSGQQGSRFYSFLSHLQDEAKEYEAAYQDFGDPNGAVPSYEYFYEAAQEQVPGYKVELAKSYRSQCVQCKNKSSRKPKTKKNNRYDVSADSYLLMHGGSDEEFQPSHKRIRKDDTDSLQASSSTQQLVKSASNFIDKGEIRVGSLDENSGSYGRWHHLRCWRVPYRVWAGLRNPLDSRQVLQDLLEMEEILLTNLSTLDSEQQETFVQHVMDKSHWAKKTKASKPPPNLREVATAKAARKGSTNKVAHDESGLVITSNNHHFKNDIDDVTALTVSSTRSKKFFVMPRPGIHGAIPDRLQGLCFVLTGVFPEVGGGAGLNLGKNKVRSMIESFGGRVTSAVYRKTSYLVIGKEPGQTKVSQAQEKNIPRIDLAALQSFVVGAINTLEDAKPPAIQSFSQGYSGKLLKQY